MGNSAPGSGGNEVEDGDNEVAKELGHLEKNKAVTFWRWIQLLVSYWVATNTVTKFSAHQGMNSTNMTLIHVRANLVEKWLPGMLLFAGLCPSLLQLILSPQNFILTALCSPE
jgi:hypothetical protein